jgi:hypothetical protein
MIIIIIILNSRQLGSIQLENDELCLLIGLQEHRKGYI